MKKFLLLSATALVATMSLQAQTVYNYFQKADVDAEGWLWLDNKDVIKKYVGIFKTADPSKYKIATVDTPYFDEITNEPVPTDPNATVKGWNTAGVKGGEGSRTGGIVLPQSETAEVSGTTNAGVGGGILLPLPDCAEIDLYISAASEKLYAAVFAADIITRPADCQYIYSYGVWMQDYPIPGLTYAGKWNNIQDLDNSLQAPPKVLTIKSAPGEPRTVYISNLITTGDLLVQGLKVLTYTDTNNEGPWTESLVEGMEADSNSDAPAYNIHGIRVDDSYKGVVIRNGKKTIRR